MSAKALPLGTEITVVIVRRVRVAMTPGALAYVRQVEERMANMEKMMLAAGVPVSARICADARELLAVLTTGPEEVLLSDELPDGAALRDVKPGEQPS